MDKIFRLISWTTIFGALIIMGTIGYWLLTPYTPILFTDLPYKVLNENKTVKTGDYLIYKVAFCKYSDVLPTVAKYFVDGIVYALPPMLASGNPIGCQTNIVQLYVPKALPAGKYTLRTNYRYQVNPIRKIDVTTATEQFIVTK